MQDLNRWTGIGRLGHAPKLSRAQDGTARCTLRVATTTLAGRAPDGTWNKRTDWHTVVAWGRTAEACDRYLAKGALVYVEGALRYREGTGRDGVQRWYTEIAASTVTFLGGGRREGANEGDPGHPGRAPGDAPPSADVPGGAYEDDIPF
jgi:single-strand DNA-binding protein